MLRFMENQGNALSCYQTVYLNTTSECKIFRSYGKQEETLFCTQYWNKLCRHIRSPKKISTLKLNSLTFQLKFKITAIFNEWFLQCTCKCFFFDMCSQKILQGFMSPMLIICKYFIAMSQNSLLAKVCSPLHSALHDLLLTYLHNKFRQGSVRQRWARYIW